MADDSWFRAVPFGLVMFLGTTFGFVYRALRKRASRTSFPELGKRLGLAYSAAETPGSAGVLKGNHRGFPVRIESETRARVVAQLGRTFALDLRNYERWVRLPPGLEPFAFPDRARNGWLRTRLVAPGLEGAVTDDRVLNQSLKKLQDHPALRELTVSEGRVEVVLDFGARGLFPVEQAEQMVNLVVDVAERLVVIFDPVAASPA